jgi:hypothetical protein
VDVGDVLEKRHALYWRKNLSHRKKVQLRRKKEEFRRKVQKLRDLLGKDVARLKDRVAYECLSGMN